MIPKVSVIIPAYNAMLYLPETMASVSQQTFTDYEVLIVNDGSTDHIVQWASQLKDLRIKLISQDNLGASIARNTAIAQARGEYFAFLDADDLWSPTKLEEQVCYLNSHPEVGLVYTWTALIDYQGKPTGTVWAANAEGYVWEQLVVIDGMISNGSVPMVRRCCFEKVGLFEPGLHCYEDRDMWIRIATRYSFGVVKEVLCYYRQHPNSISQNRQRMLNDWRKVIEKAFDTAPFEVMYLRNKCYGFMALYQSRQSLELGNWEEAMFYCQQALLHYPQLCCSKRFIFIILAIWMTRWMGPQGYGCIRALEDFLHRLRLHIMAIKPESNHFRAKA